MNAAPPIPPDWTGVEDELELLSPLDLLCVKAAGVTFALSAIERVIGEQARGDAGAADAIRRGDGADAAVIRSRKDAKSTLDAV